MSRDPDRLSDMVPPLVPNPVLSMRYIPIPKTAPRLEVREKLLSVESGWSRTNSATRRRTRDNRRRIAAEEYRVFARMGFPCETWMTGLNRPKTMCLRCIGHEGLRIQRLSILCGGILLLGTSSTQSNMTAKRHPCHGLEPRLQRRNSVSWRTTSRGPSNIGVAS